MAENLFGTAGSGRRRGRQKGGRRWGRCWLQHTLTPGFVKRCGSCWMLRFCMQKDWFIRTFWMPASTVQDFHGRHHQRWSNVRFHHGCWSPWSETAGCADENVEDPEFGLGCLNYLSVWWTSLFLLGNIGAGKAEAVKPSDSFPGFFLLHLLRVGFRRNWGNKKVVGRCLNELLWPGFTCAVSLDSLI